MPLREYCVTDIKCLKTEDGELGSGLLGTVLLGYHPNLGNIALKCFGVHGGKLEKINIETNIKQEIELLQTVNHENIVRLYGWAKWPYAMALIMEYLAGGNLNNLLFNAAVDLRPALQLRMGAEVASALASIHNLGDRHRVTHGDLKPENILLTADLHCKVGDFGSAELSNVTGLTTAADSKTSRQRNQYTKVFAAPERLANILARVKKEHDVYSYALVLFVILARQSPIGQASVEDYIEAIKNGDRPSLQTIEMFGEKGNESEKNVINLLVNVIKACWSHDPVKRLEMKVVRDRLNKLLGIQKQADITQQVLNVQQVKKTTLPIFVDADCAQLCQFNPMEKRFSQIGGESPSSKADFRPMTAPGSMTSPFVVSPRSGATRNHNVSDSSTQPKLPIGNASPNQVPSVDNLNNGRDLPPVNKSAAQLKENQLDEQENAPYSFPTQNWTGDGQHDVTMVASTNHQLASLSIATGDSNSPDFPPSAVQMSEAYTPPSAAGSAKAITIPFNTDLTLKDLFEQGEGFLLTESHRQALEQSQFQQARIIAAQASQFIRKQNFGKKASLLKGFANEYRFGGKFFEAILFYEVAQLLYFHRKYPQSTLQGIGMYLYDLSKMAESNVPEIHVNIFKGYVIPYMVKLVNDAWDIKALPNQDKAKEMGKMLKQVALAEEKLGDLESCRSHLEKALEIVKTAHGKTDPFCKELSEKLQSVGK